MRLATVGTGYVGLVTSACFAETGNVVTCLDIDQSRIASLKSGIIPIYEPGLQEVVHTNSEAGRLKFTNDYEEALVDAEIIFIAVGTPSGDDGSTDLTSVFAAAEEISKHFKEGALIVTKSTVPVGTTYRIKELIARSRNRSSDNRPAFRVASNPEFLKEGAAVEDFRRPDRVIIGVEDSESERLLRRLYAPFFRTGERLVVMDILSAELTKYAANAFLATKISFMNELAYLCEKVGADVEKVRIGLGSDPRIGKRFLFPGIGFGGSCLPKDIRSLIHTAGRESAHLGIVEAAERANRLQKERFVEKVSTALSGQLNGKRIAVWGLTFKPNTDDVREAPSLDIIPSLWGKGAVVVAFDPEGIANAKSVLGDRVEYAQSEYEALQDADALLLLTEWPQFRRPDYLRLKKMMKRPLIIDGRNQYDPQEMAELGIEYFAVGRPSKEDGKNPDPD